MINPATLRLVEHQIRLAYRLRGVVEFWSTQFLPCGISEAEALDALGALVVFEKLRHQINIKGENQATITFFLTDSFLNDLNIEINTKREV